MNKVLVLLLFPILFFTQEKDSFYELVSYDIYKNKISSKDALVFDVRTTEEFNLGHIKGSINIDFYDEKLFVKFFQKINKTKPIYIYCRSGNRSKKSSEILKESSFNNDQIMFELFYSKTSKDIGVSSNNSLATIIYDEEEITLEVPENKTLLDAALEKNIDVPYSCQGGVCSSCIAKISSGSAKMIQNNILTDSEIEEGLVLTCQAIPLSKEITVDFDDV